MTEGIIVTEGESSATRHAVRKWRSDSARSLKQVDLLNVNILVVDDDAVQRSILNKWLHDEGYKSVTLCNTGRDAWEQLTETGVKYDLVVTDLMMPGITGAGLLEMITQKFDSLPVILMSGEDKTPETAASAIEVGSQDYLFKPLIRPLFIKKICTVLENTLRQEREAAYESLMKEKEEEIKKLTSEVSVLSAQNMKVMKAIETPIEGITRTLSNILQDPSLRDLPVKRDLEDVFFTIRNNRDLYAPVIKELLKQDINPEAKSLLLTCLDPGIGRRASLPTFPIVIKEESITGLKQWNFSPFIYSEKELLPLVKNMFESFGLMERFQIPVPNLERFIMAVRDMYNQQNPYHNFTHAFDVTQTVYCLLTTMNAASYLTHLDIFSLLISALCHDIAHPGLTNAYLVETENELAIRYNDRAVLESLHCATTFDLLKKTHVDILKNLTAVERKELRSSVISGILATDMTLHFANTAKLEQRLKTGKPFERDSKEDRMMLMETVLRSADISNIAKPWETAKEWARRVSEEFFNQGDLEKREGRVAVAEFMDRTKSTYARNTASFIDFFGIHLFEVIVRIFPDTKIALAHLYENRKIWDELIREEAKERTLNDVTYDASEIVAKRVSEIFNHFETDSGYGSGSGYSSGSDDGAEEDGAS